MSYNLHNKQYIILRAIKNMIVPHYIYNVLNEYNVLIEYIVMRSYHVFIDSFPLIQYKQHPVCIILHYLFASYGSLQ